MSVYGTAVKGVNFDSILNFAQPAGLPVKAHILDRKTFSGSGAKESSPIIMSWLLNFWVSSDQTCLK